MLLPFILYLVMAIKSTDTIRKRAMSIVLGIAAVMVARNICDAKFNG